MKQKRFWLKLVGVALLVHIILIALSILEVAIYSYLVEPGKDDAFYSEHANESGPWVSAIGGSLVMFYLVRRYVRRFTDKQLTYAIMLPVIYVIIDQLIFIAAGANVMDNIGEIALSNGCKLLASLAAYYIYKGARLTKAN